MNEFIHTSVQKYLYLIRLRSIVNRALSLFSALIAILISLPLSANAQEWPVKPIKLIVSFPAGSSPDVVGRAIAVPPIAKTWTTCCDRKPQWRHWHVGC